MKSKHVQFWRIFSVGLLVLLAGVTTLARSVRAQDSATSAGSSPEATAEDIPSESEAPVASPTKGRSRADRVNVNKIKTKYWARGDEAELGVVQNRQFSKDGRFQLGILGGLTFMDPFLDVKTLGLQMGYHFNETFSFNLLAWRYFAGPSSALTTFEDTRGATANTNFPERYYGGELTGSFLYGKLALLGAKIIYYDMNLSLGGGLVDTESGMYPAPSIGLGQRFFLNKNFSLRIDYRLIVFREDIVEKQITSKLGTVQGTRTNYSNNITLGIDFLFGGD